MLDQKSREKGNEYYDELFEKQQYYNDHYSNIHYYVQWVQVEMMLRPFKDKHILEIGCGTGQFTQMLEDLGYRGYNGFDFSEVAIKKSKERTNLNVFVGDALDPATYDLPYDAVVCLEVLEHLEKDLQVLENIKEGAFVIVSVPNFDDLSHVRWFRSYYQVRKRFFRHIDIRGIRFVNNIYILCGTRSDFKPNIFQAFLKTREEISLKSFSNRIRHKLVHYFKIKHR